MEGYASYEWFKVSAASALFAALRKALEFTSSFCDAAITHKIWHFSIENLILDLLPYCEEGLSNVGVFLCAHFEVVDTELWG